MSGNDRVQEVWLHDMLNTMEEAGLLGEFCRHIEMKSPLADGAGAELAWLAVKEHYTGDDGMLRIEEACRAVLQFPPMMEVLARNMGGGA